MGKKGLVGMKWVVWFGAVDNGPVWICCGSDERWRQGSVTLSLSREAMRLLPWSTIVVSMSHASPTQFRSFSRSR